LFLHGRWFLRLPSRTRSSPNLARHQSSEKTPRRLPTLFGRRFPQRHARSLSHRRRSAAVSTATADHSAIHCVERAKKREPSPASDKTPSPQLKDAKPGSPLFPADSSYEATAPTPTTDNSVEAGQEEYLQRQDTSHAHQSVGVRSGFTCYGRLEKGEYHRGKSILPNFSAGGESGKKLRPDADPLSPPPAKAARRLENAGGISARRLQQ